MNAYAPEHVPDILDCLAQLSNDEVPTPPELARGMLDLLPGEVWSRHDYRWLDPCSKSGVFLREAAVRLLDGLSAWEPDFEKRRDHIYREMLFGASITEMTGLISRRSVYYSHNASTELSVVRFTDPSGNLPFVQASHTFEKGTCALCGAPEDLERGEKRENYAYSFIHGAYPTKEMKDMKFDVIVGNPPYQIDSDGNTRTKPVYQKFVQEAIEADPKHVLMITPSRWFAGGLGLDEFREQMLKDSRMKVLVDFPLSRDCFPGVKIRGGVSYFLWDRDHKGGCTVTTVRGGVAGEPMTRSLADYDVLVRFNEGVSIIEKVRAKSEATMDKRVSSLVPFGIRGAYSDYVKPGTPGAILLHVKSRKSQWIAPEAATANKEWVPKWKTLMHRAYGEDHDGPFSVLANPFVAEPQSACTDTYLVMGAFDTQAEAEHLAAYLRTRFARFLVWLRMNTQDIRKDIFSFVPDLDWTREWTEDDLAAHFELTEEESAVIETNIRPMSAPATAGAEA